MKTVVDTNVLIAANGQNTHADIQLRAASARYLAEFIDGEDVLLEDSCGYAFEEYKRYMQFSGQPGVGDRFFLWYLRSRWSDARVMSVEIDHETPIASYLPESLRSFDPSDHKWIAIYLEGDADVVVNVTDSDWRNAREDLLEHGIRVHELAVKTTA